jgi:hypothetical protein
MLDEGIRLDERLVSDTPLPPPDDAATAAMYALVLAKTNLTYALEAAYAFVAYLATTLATCILSLISSLTAVLDAA